MPFGHTRYGKQNHQCKACDRQFVATAENPLIAHEQRALIEHLLRERISLRGICRAVGVSLTWLLHFMMECFAACPDHLHVQLPAGPAEVVIHQLEAEADEMWSFVEKKANKQWLWIAMDATTRQIIAFHVGDRRRDSAKGTCLRGYKLREIERPRKQMGPGSREAARQLSQATSARPESCAPRDRHNTC